VPAYKHSAAQFLHLRGRIAADRPHPRGGRRPDSDRGILEELSARLDTELARTVATGALGATVKTDTTPISVSSETTVGSEASRA
jgi:hypothetical protein